MILEGCDGSGKSTLANAIAQRIRTERPEDVVTQIHSSQLKRDPLDEYGLDFQDYEPGDGTHYVIDRLHFGELIYGPLYRDKSALDAGGFRWVEMFLRARGAVTFHVSADLETIRQRLSERGEDYLQDADVEHVWRTFHDITEESLTCEGVALTDQGTPEHLAELCVMAAEHRDREAQTVFRPSYIGRALPTVLLVMDGADSTFEDITAAPFVPREKSSGSALMNALPAMWWHQLGIVDTEDLDIAELHADLFAPAVIALGEAASKKLTEANIEHSVVPHPQTIIDYNDETKTEYGKLLREASTEQGDYLAWQTS